MTEDEKAVSRRLLRQFLFLGGHTDSIDASTVAIADVLRSNGCTAEDIPQLMGFLRRKDALWAAREALQHTETDESI
jgi:predicted RNA binding protein with dsRBD fold (UPF0201 family)